MTAIRTASLIVALCVFSTVTAATAAVLDISWVAPTVNANGSVLDDLASYRVYYGASPAPCPGLSFVSVASATPSPAADEVVGVTLGGTPWSAFRVQIAEILRLLLVAVQHLDRAPDDESPERLDKLHV